MRLSGPAHGIVTKTVHKTLPGSGGSPGDGWVYGYRGWWGSRGWDWLGLGGLFDMKLTLSLRHNCLKLKMVISVELI